jgi:hypothetical protein
LIIKARAAEGVAVFSLVPVGDGVKVSVGVFVKVEVGVGFRVEFELLGDPQRKFPFLSVPFL